MYFILVVFPAAVIYSHIYKVVKAHAMPRLCYTSIYFCFETQTEANCNLNMQNIVM